MSQMSHSNIKRLIEMSHVQEGAVELQEDQRLCIVGYKTTAVSEKDNVTSCTEEPL